MTVQEIQRQSKEQLWKQRIVECRQSGISVKQWCKNQEIVPSTYYRWEQRLLEKAKVSLPSESPFAEIPLTAMGDDFIEVKASLPGSDVNSFSGESMLEPAAVLRIGKLELLLGNNITEATAKILLSELVKSAF